MFQETIIKHDMKILYLDDNKDASGNKKGSKNRFVDPTEYPRLRHGNDGATDDEEPEEEEVVDDNVLEGSAVRAAIAGDGSQHQSSELRYWIAALEAVVDPDDDMFFETDTEDTVTVNSTNVTTQQPRRRQHPYEK